MGASDLRDRCGLTGMPGRSSGPPSTMTLSPGLSPPVTSQFSPTVRSAWIDAQLRHVVCADDHHGRPAALVAADRALGDQDAAGLHALADLAADEHARQQDCCGLGKTARMACEPVAGSTVTSAKLNVPTIG